MASVCRHTNLQIPVDYSIDMAVMDTLQDLLYTVAGKGRAIKSEGEGRGWDGCKERQSRKMERMREKKKRREREK